jgi:hypothetical protein
MNRHSAVLFMDRRCHIEDITAVVAVDLLAAAVAHRYSHVMLLAA